MSSQTRSVTDPAVVGIGASAGGIDALKLLFEAMPADLGAAYVVIMHLAPDHDSHLAEILGRSTGMPVSQVQRKGKLKANHIYVIPPGRQLKSIDGQVVTEAFTELRAKRTPIDTFFRSLAAADKPAHVVVLSGGGSDGVLGCKSIKASGGVVLVQEPAEAQHDSMPRSVIAAGAADFTGPVEEIARYLADLLQYTLPEPLTNGVGRETAGFDDQEDKSFAAILDLLRAKTGTDFSAYKRNTVLRRMLRRMQINGCPNFSSYREKLRADSQELELLFHDILITVTRFFRDPVCWHALEERVIDKMISNLAPGEPIRVWVPGCATGEEAYSIAILITECLERQGAHHEVTVFATDIDPHVIAIAREARYPAAIVADIAPKMLGKYFIEEDNYHVVSPKIRDIIVFAVHDLLRDPPFIRVNLVSCRNLLIYFSAPFQEQAQKTFRYSLIESNGFLFTGTAEMMSEEWFETLDRRARIFRPKQGVSPQLLDIRPGMFRGSKHEAGWRHRPGPGMHVDVVEQLAPPSLLVDAQGRVVSLSRNVGRFLEIGGGVLSARVVELVRPELRGDISRGLQQVLRNDEKFLSPQRAVRIDGQQCRVSVLIQPRSSDQQDFFALVLFLDAGEVDTRDEVADGEETDAAEHVGSFDTGRQESYELHEDLEAANEELQSLNEEYRATAEELETNKEELQSVNEELQTVNDQLKSKLEEVSNAHDDLGNFMAATEIGILFLDRECRIRRFTPIFRRYFNLTQQDVGRPLADFTHTLDYNDLLQDAKKVLQDLAPIDRYARTQEAEVLIRLLPYRTKNDRIDGVVITVIDITREQAITRELRESEANLERELDAMRRLHRMTVETMNAGTLTDALHRVLEAAIDLLGCDFGTIHLMDEKQGTLALSAHAGAPHEILESQHFIPKNMPGIHREALRHKSPLVINDLSDREAVEHLDLELTQGAVRASPLVRSDNSVVGVLCCYRHAPYEWQLRDGQIGDLLARASADLIERRAQERKLADSVELLQRQTEDMEEAQSKLARHAADLASHDQRNVDFLGILGHELRNPLAAVQSSLELLPADDANEAIADSAVKRRALAIIGRQTGHMARLIRDILDIGRLNHGKFELQLIPLDLTVTLQNIVVSWRARYENAGIELVLEAPVAAVVIKGDQDRIEQVFDNLLSNSLKFCDPGDAVRVTLKADETQAIARVEDTGIGIAAESMENVFKPYRQIGRHRDGGLGLGLALTRSLLEHQDGEIDVSSEGLGKGACFVVRLPLTQANKLPDRQQAAALSKAWRILVVDDQKDVADSLGELLTAMGNDVGIAYGGEQAIEAARELEPDVAILDLSMPGMSGAELARELRKIYRPEQLRIIGLTGYAGTRQPEDLGFDHCIHKPVSRAMLAAILEESE